MCAKDKVVGAKDYTQKETDYDAIKDYQSKMKEHEPTAVRREMTNDY